MKTKYWVLCFSLFALLCVLLSFPLFRTNSANYAEVYSNGKQVQRLDLRADGEYRISSGEHWNLLRVEDGRISVIDSSCAGKDCIHIGSRDGGAPIVCLPNRLVIEFSSDEELDAILH